MKCPKKKCGFISFDYLDACKKCGADLTQVRQELGLLDVEPTIAFALDILIEEGTPILSENVKTKKVLSLDEGPPALEQEEMSFVADLPSSIEEISLDISTGDLDKFIEETESRRITPFESHIEPSFQPGAAPDAQIFMKSSETPSKDGLQIDFFDGDITPFKEDVKATEVRDAQPPALEIDSDIVMEERPGGKKPLEGSAEKDAGDLDLDLDLDLNFDTDLSDFMKEVESGEEVGPQTRIVTESEISMDGMIESGREELLPKLSDEAATDKMEMDLDPDLDLDADLSDFMKDMESEADAEPRTRLVAESGASVDELLPAEEKASLKVSDEVGADEMDLDLDLDLDADLSGLMEGIESEEEAEPRTRLVAEPEIPMDSLVVPEQKESAEVLDELDEAGADEITLDLDADLSDLMKEMESDEENEPLAKLAAEPSISLEKPSEGKRDEEELILPDAEELDKLNIDFEEDLSRFMQEMQSQDSFKTETKVVPSTEFRMDDSEIDEPKDMVLEELDLDDLIKELERASTKK